MMEGVKIVVQFTDEPLVPELRGVQGFLQPANQDVKIYSSLI